MSKKLSPRQVEDLFTFCREHYVYHYDLQLELVDHLASGIEQLWEEDPRLTYTEALWKVFGKFGIYGFAKVRKAKEKTLRKKYMRQQWQYIGEFYKLPKIILTIALSLALFTVFRLTENNGILLFTLFASMSILALYQMFFRFPRKYLPKLVPGMSFLLFEQLKTYRYAGGGLLYCTFYFSAMSRVHDSILNVIYTNNIWLELFISFLFVFTAIVQFTMFEYLPRRIKADFIRDYSQFVKA